MRADALIQARLLWESVNGGQQYAYHVTSNAHLPSIAKEGLKPHKHQHLGDDEGIFVEPDEDEAGVYHEPGKTTMLRFPVSKDYRWASTDDGEYIHYDHVPSHHIEAKHGDKFVPLRRHPLGLKEA